MPLSFSFGFDVPVGLGNELGPLDGTAFLCFGGIRLGVGVVLQHFLPEGIRYFGIGGVPIDAQHRIGIVGIEGPLEFVFLFLLWLLRPMLLLLIELLLIMLLPLTLPLLLLILLVPFLLLPLLLCPC